MNLGRDLWGIEVRCGLALWSEIRQGPMKGGPNLAGSFLKLFCL